MDDRPETFVKKPALPASLKGPPGPGALAFCAFCLLFFLVPAALSIWVVEEVRSWAVALALLVPLFLLSQHGIHLLAIAGHEGLHGNLHRNQQVSIQLGLFLSSMAVSYLVTGYYVHHWRHHRDTNSSEDPDSQAYSRFGRFASRFFLSRMHLTKIYRRDTYRLAFNRDFASDRLPFRLAKLRQLARFNLAYQSFWIAAYAGLGFVDPTWLFVAVVVPHLGAVAASGLRAYIEHAGTEAVPGREARSYIAPTWTLLFFGNNMHLEHHLYPSVPCYRLPAVHRWLRSTGFLDRAGSHVETSAFGALRYMRSSYPYPLVAARVPLLADVNASGGTAEDEPSRRASRQADKAGQTPAR